MPHAAHPQSVPPPNRAAVHLLHVCARGAREGETQAGRGLLRHLVSTAEVHRENALGGAETDSQVNNLKSLLFMRFLKVLLK